MLNKFFIFIIYFIIFFRFYGCSKGDPELYVNPFKLDFRTNEIEKQFTIENIGNESGLFTSGVKQLKYEIELPNDADWITVDPTYGTCDEEKDYIKVTINRDILNPGSYNKIIKINSNGGNKEINIVAIQEALPAPSWPTPVNNAKGQELTVELTWNCQIAHSFDVIFDTQNPPQNKVAKNVRSKHYIIDSLNFGKTYYWQVIAHYAKIVSGDTIMLNWKEVPGPIWNFTTKDGKAEIVFPANNSTNQELSLKLQWHADDAKKYDIYFGTDNPPTTLIGKDKTETNKDISGLSYNTKYYWKVDSYYASPNIKIEGNIWNFTTKERFSGNPGFKLTKHHIETELPSFVNIMFQVTNLDGLGIEDLNTSDFEVLEDNQPVSPTESAMQIRKKDVIPYTLKTVLMLDNSNSVAANLQEIKNAAVALVENIESQQEIAIYKFSENVELVQDFSNDVNALKNAINSIQLGYASTDLYGAIIEGVSRWNDSYSTKEIEQGFLVALTDGRDTQGSHTKMEALNARGNKKVYTVGLGNEIDPDVLQELGNAGFFSITNVSELVTKFTEIQSEMTLYANSFYWLNYISPKRGDKNHTLKLSIKNNPYTGSDSYITGQFNSKDFYSIFQGLYVNVDEEHPEGIDDLTVADTIAYRLTAITYLGNNPPEYEWETSDSTIVKLEINKDNSSNAIVRAAGNSGTCEITVYDVANNLQKIISINCLVEPSVRINATEEKPEGIDELEILETDTVSLTASTYLQNNPPQYTWASANESVVKVEPYLKNSALASIIAVGDSGQTTTIIVEDVANNLSKTIDVVITKSSIPTDGLVAYYPFNGNANDESGNGNDGTVYGATLTTDRFGNENSAYYFDGYNDYIEIPNTDQISPSNAITLSAWINFEYGGRDNPRFISKDGISATGYEFITHSTSDSREITFSIKSIGNISSPGKYNSNEWLHLVGTYDGSQICIYINGFLVNSENITGTIAQNNYSLWIGQRKYNGLDDFKGIIDDIRIYNRSLNSNEVRNLFRENGWH
ncbi:LamG-like jellyroll fold domain-containing protein [Calditrichota bacterium GD2]